MCLDVCTFMSPTLSMEVWTLPPPPPSSSLSLPDPAVHPSDPYAMLSESLNQQACIPWPVPKQKEMTPPRGTDKSLTPTKKFCTPLFFERGYRQRLGRTRARSTEHLDGCKAPPRRSPPVVPTLVDLRVELLAVPSLKRKVKPVRGLG